MKAIFDGDIEKFDSFVQQGFDVNTITGKDKWNLLHRTLVSVSIRPVPKMIKKLIDCGVDVNAKDNYGNTPLHYASRLKNTEIIEILLDSGAEIDPANNKGFTPLREMLLVKPHKFDAIELLLTRGADMHHAGKKGVTVRDYVKVIAHGENSKLLDVFDKYLDKTG